MTIRELTALVLLYRAAHRAARDRALELVPDLKEWFEQDNVSPRVAPVICPDHPMMTARDSDGTYRCWEIGCAWVEKSS